MEPVFDVRTFELLCARMCHDLISPISAIGNGIELVTELGDDGMQGEALSLIGESAVGASGLLQFYRAVLGSGRAADGGPLGLAEARERANGALGGGRISVEWIVEDARDVTGLAVKLSLALVLAANDLLPGSGKIEVRLEREGEGLKMEVAALRDGLALSHDFRGALDGTATAEMLTPRNVTGRYGRLLVQSCGGTFQFVEEARGVLIRAVLPKIP